MTKQEFLDHGAGLAFELCEIDHDKDRKTYAIAFTACADLLWDVVEACEYYQDKNNMHWEPSEEFPNS